MCENFKPVSFLDNSPELLLETGFIEKNVVIWPRDLQTKPEIKLNDLQSLPKSTTLSSNSNRSNPTEKPVLKASPITMLGVSGLVNLGNTCFMNTVLQCLLHTPMFSDLFLGDSILSFIHPLKQKEKNLLALQMNALAKEMATNKTSKVIPTKFHKNFIKKFPMFSGSEQHDCHECLSLILDSLHEELRRVGDDTIRNTLVLENPADKSIEIKEADEQ
jgi:Ubiquitin C-terminal hydrolase